MNKIAVIALSLAVFIAPAYAQQDSSPVHTCEDYGAISYLIMMMRQDGLPINELMEIDTTRLNRLIVLEAYKRPIFSKDADKLSEIREFANVIMTKCYSALLN